MPNSNEPAGRFVAWTALAIFSAVALTAHETDDDSGDRSTGDKWVTSVTAISMSFAFLAMIAHFVARERFEGEPMEAGFAFLLICLWAGGLPVIMNPDNNLANSEVQIGDDFRFVIANTNLYFSAWGAFISNLYILASLAKAEGIADVSSAPPKTSLWIGLFAASFVVMVSSSRFFSTFCDDGSATCRRTKYAISLGAFGTVVCMVLSYLSAKAMVAVSAELGLSAFLLIMYTFGVGYITFNDGPGTTIGNLYFSTWIGFILSLFLTAKCVRHVCGGNSNESEAEPPEVPPSVAPVDKV